MIARFSFPVRREDPVKCPHNQFRYVRIISPDEEGGEFVLVEDSAGPVTICTRCGSLRPEGTDQWFPPAGK